MLRDEKQETQFHALPCQFTFYIMSHNPPGLVKSILIQRAKPESLSRYRCRFTHRKINTQHCITGSGSNVFSCQNPGFRIRITRACHNIHAVSSLNHEVKQKASESCCLITISHRQGISAKTFSYVFGIM